jgi:hypothetical protein
MQWDLTARSDAAVIRPLFRRAQEANVTLGTGVAVLPFSSTELQVPHYLRAHYWWAYIHPKAVKLFERQWLVNLILGELRPTALSWQKWETRCRDARCRLHVYGDLTSRLSAELPTAGADDVVDAPDTLAPGKKLPRNAGAIAGNGSTNLDLPDASHDRVLIFSVT